MQTPAIPPPPAPIQPPTAPELADPAQKAAREEARKRAMGLQGYSSTIATSGLGVTTPAPLTTGYKALLGS